MNFEAVRNAPLSHCKGATSPDGLTVNMLIAGRPMRGKAKRSRNGTVVAPPTFAVWTLRVLWTIRRRIACFYCHFLPLTAQLGIIGIMLMWTGSVRAWHGLVLLNIKIHQQISFHPSIHNLNLRIVRLAHLARALVRAAPAIVRLVAWRLGRARAEAAALAAARRARRRARHGARAAAAAAAAILRLQQEHLRMQGLTLSVCLSNDVSSKKRPPSCLYKGISSSTAPR